MRSLEVRISGHPPGGNDLHRMGRWAVRKSRETWKGTAHQEAVRAAIASPWGREYLLTGVGRAGRKDIPEADWWPLSRASLAVTWRYRVRRNRDLDNLVAGLKPIIDGLVSSGIILDDHSGVLVSLGPFNVETGSETDETVLRIQEEG
jgi:hypothetical protein